MKLSDLPKCCFQGVIPAVITTCDGDGVPNVTYLSQVFFLDDRQVALSCQFFNKTKRNVLLNPHANVELYDPRTLDGYRLDLRYDRAETVGPLFDRMAARIDAIASHTGMKGIFKLISADVYDVLGVEGIPDLLRPPTHCDVAATDESSFQYKTELAGLQMVSQRICRATDLDGLFATVLEALAEAIGFEHSMVLLLDESGTRLYAIASRGYGQAEVGAEVGVGEGLIGTVARERCILRVAGVGAELRYGRAVRASVHRALGARALAPEIPLPGLVDAQSQMALPLAVGDRLVGVIAVESRVPSAFEEWHEAYLEIIANQVAVAIDTLVERGRDGEVGDAPEAPATSQALASPAPCPAGKMTKKIRYYPSDDCVFVDDVYLVRNMPGKILWRILRDHQASGRTEFTNRELRLDASLGLPAIRDNLESRLVLLRKRLEQKCSDLALVPVGRGKFSLRLGCAIELAEAK